ncbi:MAG: oligosaccharide flippase family protein, partial [Alistipes sp.]|nr:oligosaccharide flippase family protein [Alistipes sp.]
MASQNRATALAKNTLILTIGKISTQAISFFLLPLYTAYLTKQDYGVVDLVSTIVTLLIPILNLQIEQGIFRFMVTNRDDKQRLSSIISTSFTFLFAQVLLVTAIFIVANFFVTNEYRWFLYANLV